MHRGVILRDTSRHRVNHDLAPFDIQAGGDPWVIWQGPGYSGGEEGGGGEECVMRDVRSGKNNQVPLGGPLRSRNLNIGMDRIRGKGGITDVDQNRGSKSHNGPQGRRKCVMSQAKHKARPERRGGVLGLAVKLGQVGLGAEGRLGGAWSGCGFRGDFGKGCTLLTLFLTCLSHCARWYSPPRRVTGRHAL